MKTRKCNSTNKNPLKPNISQLPITTDSNGRSTTSFINEKLINYLDLPNNQQPFPGAVLPDLTGVEKFPIPDKPASYCSKEEFLQAPKYLAQWVHWESRVESVLKGDYFGLTPVHFEGIFTLTCNFLCPHCTRRTTRSKWIDDSTWDNNVPISGTNSLNLAGIKLAIDQLAEIKSDNQMGIVWGGGEPALNPPTYKGMEYAKSKGISSSFITNGVLIDVDECLESEPTLIRISLNCGTEEGYRKFHGYPSNLNYFQQVLEKTQQLASIKVSTRSRTLVGISLIIDERNFQDTIAAAKKIRSIVENAGGGIDYVIVRPVMHYAHFEGTFTKINSNTKEKALGLVTDGGEIKEILDQINVPLILIKDSFEDYSNDIIDNSECLAYGLCGEIRHNGDVQLCSDSYGNPDYTIGNIFTHDIGEILKSKKRKDVLQSRNLSECYKYKCPHNSRGHHHNRVFHQIEKLRAKGEIHLVEKWINDLKSCTIPLGHSFFI